MYESIRGLRHRRDILGVQFIQPLNVTQNRSQFFGQALAFLIGKLQIGQIGHVGYVGLSNFHIWLCSSWLLARTLGAWCLRQKRLWQKNDAAHQWAQKIVVPAGISGGESEQLIAP